MATIGSAGSSREAVQRVLDDAVSSGVTPGIVTEVRNGVQRWFASAGKADIATGRERKPGELFRIGSAAKAFTAATTLKLVGDRVLSLDDTVEMWLPGLLDDSHYDGGTITLRQLLNQTSGIYNFSIDPEFYASGQGEAWYERRFKVFTPEQLVRIGLRHPPYNAPGEAFRYSNTQYYLAAMMVEKATGESYGEVLDRLILRPLNLTGTSLPTTQTAIPGPHPVHYSRLELPDPAAPLHDATESNETTAWSAGGMISTTGDLLTFFSALFSGHILKPVQMEEMFTTVSTDGAGWLPNTRYGLGVWVEQKLDSGVPVWGNGGADYGTFTLVMGSRDGTHTVASHVNTDFSPQAYAAFLAILDIEFGSHGHSGAVDASVFPARRARGLGGQDAAMSLTPDDVTGWKNEPRPSAPTTKPNPGGHVRKVVLAMMTTLNGRLDGPDAWVTAVSEDHYQEIDRGYATFDTILVGRVTAEEMFEYWPGARGEEGAGESHRAMAEKMHSYKKYVFTTDPGLKLEWHNTEAVVVSSDDEIRSFVEDLRAQPGGDIHLSGGARLAQTFVRLGLVEEFRFFVFPVYSPGASWFGQLDSQKTLELISSTAFDSGVVAMYCKTTG